VATSIWNPERQEEQLEVVPEHSAQFELQAAHLPLMAVYPLWQPATQFPLETIPEMQVQTPFLGEAPNGQESWHLPWKK
jgi:hypothetical protein